MFVLNSLLCFIFSGFSPGQRLAKVTSGVASLQVSNGNDA